MKISKVYIMVADNRAEEHVLLEVINAHYPFNYNRIGMPPREEGKFYPCGTFHATEDQHREVVLWLDGVHERG